MTPGKMSSSERSAPFLMSNGRTTLSIAWATTVTTRSPVARPGEPAA